MAKPSPDATPETGEQGSGSVAKRIRKARKAAGSSGEKGVQQAVSRSGLEAPPASDPARSESIRTRAAAGFRGRQVWLARGGVVLLAVLFAVWAPSGEERLGTFGYLSVAVVLMIGCGSLGFLLGRQRRPAETAEAHVDVLHRSTSQTRQSYHHDAATGLHSRWALERRLAEEIERSRRYGRPLALIVIRIDSSSGPDRRAEAAPSQAVLRGIGEAIRSSARKIDFAARYSHDSIAILAPETGRTGAEALAARFTKALARLSVSHGGKSYRPNPSLSWGIALLPDDGATVSELVEAVEGRLPREQTLAA